MEETNYRVTREGDDELKHYGVKGMRWGVRNEPKPDSRSQRRRREEVRESMKRVPVRRENAGAAINRLADVQYRNPELRSRHGMIEVRELHGTDKDRAARFVDRERRSAELAKGGLGASIRDFLGEDESIRLERASEQYRNAVEAMSKADKSYAEISEYGGNEVVIGDDGKLMFAAVTDLIRNPGMTEKELIEKMQQTRAAVAQAQAAFDKTPVGAIKKLAQKGKQKVRRFIADIKRKLKNRKK